MIRATEGATRLVFRRPRSSQPMPGARRGALPHEKAEGPTNRVRDTRDGGGARSGLDMVFTKTRTVDTPTALDEVVPVCARLQT